MKSGKGVIVVFVVIGLLFAGGFLWEHLDEKHEEELIQMAQDANLGDGVTLQKAVQAYFGDPGEWYVAGDDTILLDAGNLNGHVLHATFKVNQKTEQLDILTFQYDYYDVSTDELESIISDMIRAAKR